MSHDGHVQKTKEGIDFIGRYRPDSVTDVCHALNALSKEQVDPIVLNFGGCTAAFPNSMLPLITQCARLRSMGCRIVAFPSNAPDVKQRFLDTNWAHHLSPELYKVSDDYAVPHLAVKQYQSSAEHHAILLTMLDLVMRTVHTPRSALASLEWSLSEIMDNVLNHANTDCGGYVQLAIFPNDKKLAFTVADAGRGILESLKEAIPTLNSDRVAIEEAVRAGVTRNKDFGQGNGMSGSLALAMQTGGWFRVRSGQAEIVWMPPNPDPRYHNSGEGGKYYGTTVDVQLPYEADIDVGAIINAASHFPSFAPVSYTPTDIIELRHTIEDGKAIILRMREETAGFGSRHTGQQMRTKAQNLLRAEAHLPLIVDWDGIQMIASSYADEFIGKLFVELGPLGFMARVHLVNLAPVVQTLINKAIVQRTQQL